jgi:hypothetical protein
MYLRAGKGANGKSEPNVMWPAGPAQWRMEGCRRVCPFWQGPETPEPWWSRPVAPTAAWESVGKCRNSQKMSRIGFLDMGFISFMTDADFH